MSKCCLNCDLRHATCHVSCTSYLKEKSNTDAISRLKYEENDNCVTAKKVRPQRRLGGLK